jgi:hypothetical protein
MQLSNAQITVTNLFAALIVMGIALLFLSDFMLSMMYSVEILKRNIAIEIIGWLLALNGMFLFVYAVVQSFRNKTARISHALFIALIASLLVSWLYVRNLPLGTYRGPTFWEALYWMPDLMVRDVVDLVTGTGPLWVYLQLFNAIKMLVLPTFVVPLVITPLAMMFSRWLVEKRSPRLSKTSEALQS